ncbi:MAG TPA: lysine--tRNA ligase [Candidatus Nanoarchaeia archaeon]|nr:lysine--tRNA ligase [Candidatus Nanoarchaeia archaeon]
MSNEKQAGEIHSGGERDDRLKKLAELKKSGINPFPENSARTHSIIQTLENFGDLEAAKEKIILAGRIMIKREFGNLTFVELYDGTGKIQLALSKKDLGADEFKKFAKLIDMGDFIEASGTCFVTHKGEKSLMVAGWKILAKALLPLPEKWHGLKDEDERLRLRYLDILANPETKELFIKKSKFWDTVRKFLAERGFIEVETPILETSTGGADARPFVTHHNALDLDVFLRISTGELWQKRLMVAGFEKTFEIGRQFRNEGMDAEHLQDYTQLEFYWAYANHEDGMELVEELYREIAKKVFGTLKFKIRGFEVDLGKDWERYDYQETVKKYTGIDVLNCSERDIKTKLNELNVEFDEKGFNVTRAIDNLWKYCRKQLAGPGFLVGVPKVVSPLAKADPERPELTERFQPIIAGSELGNGYSELNDPLDQAARFAAQQKLREAGDEEAQMFDHEFVEALEHGMPPTCGFGMSERLFAFLADKPARECQLFPLMKPKSRNT